MKTGKRLLSILLGFIMVLGVCAVGFTAGAADGLTVNVEFGADHASYAQNSFGSVDGFTVSGSTVSFQIDADATVFDAASSFTDSLIEYAADPYDKLLKRMDTLGLKPIEEYAEGSEFYHEDRSGKVTDGMTLYVLWQKPAKVRAVVQPPKPGTEITFVNNYNAGGGNASPTSSPAPSISVYGNAKLFRSPYHENTDGFWCDNAQGEWQYGYPYGGFFTGTVDNGKTYYASFQIEADFGYYVDETIADNITVNDGVSFILNSVNSVTAAVTASDSVPVYIIPDKFECSPGDTVNYTVSMGAVEDFGGIQLKLDIPEGFTFADFELANNLSNTLNVSGNGAVTFNKSNKQLLAFGCDYTSDSPITLMTFSCTVDEDAQGEAVIDLPVCIISDKDALQITSDYYSSLSAVKVIDPEAVVYYVGDIIEYGTYPQSGVTDETTVAALNEKLSDGGWVSYGYYSGTGTWNDGQMTPGEFMKYQDVVLDSVKYRAVKFDSYRPYATGYTSSADNSNQDENGYSTDTTYWFKYEPIEWRVLDPEEGFIVCNSAIDSQAYNSYILYADSEYWGNADKEYRANDYANSSIRVWLNDDFMNTSFSASQQDNIKVTELDNSCPYDENYNSATTNDKIFLLSYNSH